MAKDWRTLEEKKEGPITDPVEQARRRAKRARKIFYVLAAIGALLGGVVAVVLLVGLYTQPYFLTVPVIEYKNPEWPVNPLAEQDGDALSVYFPSHDKRSVAIESQSRRALLEQLRGLKQDRGHPTLVFHLNALARYAPDGPDGVVYVIPADAGPDDRPLPDFLIRLDDVIDAMRDCPAKSKLLILDLAHPVADPRLGILTNDVADHVHARLKTLEKEGKLPFPVLCPCGPGQESLIREEYRLSAFAFYLAEGCRGKADGMNPEHRTNNRVSVMELYEYAKGEVDNWASRFRNRRQTPTMYGTPMDFDLVILDRAKEAIGDPKPPEPIAYPDWLLDGWKLRDSWWAPDPAYREAPRAFARLEAALLRAEKRWRGGLGGDEKRARSELDVVPELQQEVSTLRAAKRPQARSLAQELARGAVPPKDLVPVLTADLVKRDGAAPPPNPDNPDDPKAPKDPKDAKAPPPAPAPKDDKKKPPAEVAKTLLDKFKERSDFDVAWSVITFVRQTSKDDLDADKLAALNIVLARSKGKLNTRYAETLCFARLVDLQARLKDLGKNLDVERIQQVLRLTADCEAALAADPRVLFWFRAKLLELSNRRYAAEAKIFQEDSPTTTEVGLQDLETVGKDFQSVLDNVQVMQNAFLLDDQMMILLPGYIPYLTDLPKAGDPAVSDRWLGTARHLEKLHDLLQLPEGDGATPPIVDITTVMEDLKNDRAALRRPFEQREEIELNMDRSGPVQFLDLMALFESPRVFAEERKRLWKLAQEFAIKLRARPVEPMPGEFDRAATRAQLAISLLHLGGFVDADKLQREKDQVVGSNNRDPVAWAPLAEKLRVAYAVDLPAQLAKTTDLAAADRLLRVLPPYDRSPATVQNPGAKLRAEQARKFAEFLADLYKQQLAAAAPDSLAEKFYQASAFAYESYVRSTP